MLAEGVHLALQGSCLDKCKWGLAFTASKVQACSLVLRHHSGCLLALGPDLPRFAKSHVYCTISKHK